MAVALACSPRAAVLNGKEEPQQVFEQSVRPLTKEYCLGCHSTAKHKGDFDLERFSTLKEVKKHPEIWQRIVERLQDEEMPPEGKPQPADAERKQLVDWTHGVLDAFQQENAGDPGPVVLRRLSNAEYTYTVRDLTGIASLDPVREFPPDGAAGEGFSNTGQALVMSPQLVKKYFDAATAIASHAVLLPNGIRFSTNTTQRDWTDEILAEIRTFYGKYSDAPSDVINLKGLTVASATATDPGKGGRLPLEKYLDATVRERQALNTGTKTTAGVAREYHLSPKYLDRLWKSLNEAGPSPILDSIRARWRAAGLYEGGPKSWMEAVTPISEEQEVRLKLAPLAVGNEIVFYMAAGDAGDGSAGDILEWQKARLLVPGQPELLLRDARRFVRDLTARRQQIFGSTTEYLTAAAEIDLAKSEVDVSGVARRYGIETDTLKVWLDYLGVGGSDTNHLALFTNPLTHVTAWDFVQGWGRKIRPEWWPTRPATRECGYPPS